MLLESHLQESPWWGNVTNGHRRAHPTCAPRGEGWQRTQCLILTCERAILRRHRCGKGCALAPAPHRPGHPWELAPGGRRCGTLFASCSPNTNAPCVGETPQI
jgi:hypothetical protein